MNRKQTKALLVALGVCPALAAAGTAWSGLVLGIAAAAVAVLVNLLSGLLGTALPVQARVPVSVTLSAALAALAGLVAEAFLPASVYADVGAWIPLLAVYGVLLSAACAKPDSGTLYGTALWGIAALTVAGLAREFFGSGTLFGVGILPEGLSALGMISGVPGVFLILALVGMALNALSDGGKEEAP